MIMDGNGQAARKRPRSWWYPWIFVGLFAIVIVVNGIMMFLAVDTFPGLETEGHYTKGLEYNKTLAAVEAQKQLGWNSRVDFISTGMGTGNLNAVMTDKAGRALDGLQVHAVILRPTSEGHDQTVDLLPIGPGTYGSDITLPLTGQWKVNLYARRGDDLHHSSDRIQVR